jgi:hypothetical protein
MSRCKLDIELDDPEATFSSGRPGSQVEGRLRVAVDKSVRCKALTITRLWRTHGKGNRQSGEPESQILFAGEWAAGDNIEYAFAFDVPDDPLTHHGRLLNVDWYLEARADIPWAIDPKAKREFFVEAAADRVLDIRRASELSRGRAGEGLAPVVVGAVVAFSYLFFLPQLWGHQPVVAVFAGVVVLGLVGVTLRNYLAKLALKRVDLRLTRMDASHLDLQLAYSTPRKLNSVSVKLVVEEVVVEGSGTDKSTYRERLYENGPTTMRPTSEGELRGELAIPNPSEVGWPFSCRDNDVNWFIEVKFDIAAWPDYTQVIPLQVEGHPAGYKGHQLGHI